MNKKFVLLVIGLLVLSSVSAFADSEDKTEFNEKMKGPQPKLMGEKLGACEDHISEVFPNASDKQIKEACPKKQEGPVQKIKAKFSAIKEKQEMHRQGFEERKILKSELGDIKKSLSKSMAKFKEHKENFNANKEEFFKLKEELADCNSDCDALEAEILEIAKTTTLDSINLLIEHLNEIQLKISSSDQLSDEWVDEITLNVDAKISELENLKAAVADSSSKEDFRSAKSQVQSLLRNFGMEVRKYTAINMQKDVRDVMRGSEDLELTFACALDKMQAEGIDAAEFETALDTFGVAIDSSNGKLESARELFSDLKELKYSDSDNKEDVAGLISQIKSETSAAHQALKDAHTQAKFMLEFMKSNGIDFKDCRDFVYSEAEE